MRKMFCLFVMSLVVFVVQAVSFANDSGRYPNAVYKLVINKENLPKYAELARAIGFEILKTYSYTEYADIKRGHNLGEAGKYDFLLLSTGGTEWNDEDYQKFIQQPCGWETIYYSNVDMTVIHEVCQDPDGVHSWVRILKADKGQHPFLYSY